VRYGNVVGSRGSVVPLFRKLIAEGATSLPITDERMTRFWITVQQGVEFVIDCFARMYGGEIFVPKLPSIRIVDLAEALAPGIRKDIVGIRPGEKLHEQMVTSADSMRTLEFERHFVIKPTIKFSDKDVDYQVSRTGEKGHDVDPGFSYDSGTNKEFLTVEMIRRLNGCSAN
jgi:UDP-N-acetylglucosamine 4,6-dehydratase